MTNTTQPKRRRLSMQILGIIGFCAVLAALLFILLRRGANAIVEVYCFQNDIPMTEFDWLRVDNWVFTAAMSVSAGFFVLLFLFLITDRLRYIRTLTAGIHSIRTGAVSAPIEPEGNNELTELACAINDMHTAQQQLREKEQALAQEKEQFIRTMSHDIRTPLTSILAYADYLCNQQASQSEQTEYLMLIQKKALQIRDLTDILLDGSKRNVEHFADARLLMEQLCAEFEEPLEDRFAVDADLSGCNAFSGSFDVQELRRIFDNLGSNIQKYADPAQPVELKLRTDSAQLQIWQSNAVLPNTSTGDSYRLGLHSIRRIAQLYGGQVTVQEEPGIFTINITLSDF